jgi:uncharacterized protein YqeY
MISVDVHQDMINAMKNKDKLKKDVLSLLYSKLKNKSIELKQLPLEDTESIKIVQKFIKELDDEIVLNIKVNRNETADNLKLQKEFILKYLPKMLSESEIKVEIETLVDKSLPVVMKHFKMNFNGKVDMSLVNKIAKTY